MRLSGQKEITYNTTLEELTSIAKIYERKVRIVLNTNAADRKTWINQSLFIEAIQAKYEKIKPQLIDVYPHGEIYLKKSNNSQIINQNAYEVWTQNYEYIRNNINLMHEMYNDIIDLLKKIQIEMYQAQQFDKKIFKDKQSVRLGKEIIYLGRLIKKCTEFKKTQREILGFHEKTNVTLYNIDGFERFEKRLKMLEASNEKQKTLFNNILKIKKEHKIMLSSVKKYYQFRANQLFEIQQGAAGG